MEVEVAETAAGAAPALLGAKAPAQREAASVVEMSFCLADRTAVANLASTSTQNG